MVNGVINNMEVFLFINVERHFLRCLRFDVDVRTQSFRIRMIV